MKNRHEEMRSKFFTLENHFLNTFYSGLYLSAADFIRIGKHNGLTLAMHSREMLIKELLNDSDEKGTLMGVISGLNQLIDERIATYTRLSVDYPLARKPLAKLGQKATNTKSLLARNVRGNPYE
jgi:hypothetical protein